VPRPKKQVMMERPEELLRSYYEKCTCRGDQYGSPGACDICKTQPEALAQLKKMRKRLVLMEAYQPQPTGGPTSWKEDGKLSAEEFEETCRALYTAITFIQKNGTKEQQAELHEAFRRIVLETVTEEQTSVIRNDTVTNTRGATCASSGVVRVGPAEVAFPKEGTELHETLKKKGLLYALKEAAIEFTGASKDKVIKQEREACAKVIEAEMKGSKGYDGGIGDELAAAIRARSALSEDKALPEEWE